METMHNAPRSLVLSTRLYQALLAVYPSEFRRDYGAPMLQVFRDSCKRALCEHGTAGLFHLWIRTMLDTVQTALEEHTQRGVDMSKPKFFKLSGWSMILGPLLFMIGAWASSRPPYVSYAASSLPIDRYLKPAATPLIVLGLLLISLGILGLLLRYAPKLNLVSVLLAVALLAGLLSAGGAALLAVTDSSPWWELFILGLGVQYVALAIFGFIDLHRRLLPRWNGLPVLGLWFPVTLVLSLGFVPWVITFQFLGWLWLLTCIMFAGLGYLLLTDNQPAAQPAEA